MAVMIDTNVAIHLRDGDDAILSRVGAVSEPLVMSMITRVELQGGVYRFEADRETRRARLDVILKAIPGLDFDEAAAHQYGLLLSQTGYARRKLLDRMIGAHALSRGLPLATMNVSDFADLPGLKLLDWRS